MGDFAGLDDGGDGWDEEPNVSRTAEASDDVTAVVTAPNPASADAIPPRRQQTTRDATSFPKSIWADFWAGECLSAREQSRRGTLFVQVTPCIRSARPKGFEPLTF